MFLPFLLLFSLSSVTPDLLPDPSLSCCDAATLKILQEFRTSGIFISSWLQKRVEVVGFWLRLICEYET